MGWPSVAMECTLLLGFKKKATTSTSNLHIHVLLPVQPVKLRWRIEEPLKVMSLIKVAVCIETLAQNVYPILEWVPQKLQCRMNGYATRLILPT